MLCFSSKFSRESCVHVYLSVQVSVLSIKKMFMEHPTPWMIDTCTLFVKTYFPIYQVTRNTSFLYEIPRIFPSSIYVCSTDTCMHAFLKCYPS